MIIRSPGALFNDTYAFYQSNLKLLVSITLISGVLQALVSYLTPTEGNPVSGVIPLVVLLIAFAAAVFVGVIATAALVLAIKEPGQYQSPVDALKAARTFFFPMIWAGFLSGIVIIGGFLLFIIPGIIFMIWYGFVYYTLILEKKRGWEALKASKAYVVGNWWPVFGRVMALIAVILALTLIIEFFLSMLMLGKPISSAVSALIASLYSPFVLTYMYLVYEDLKAGPQEVLVATPEDVPPTTPIEAIV